MLLFCRKKLNEQVLHCEDEATWQRVKNYLMCRLAQRTLKQPQVELDTKLRVAARPFAFDSPGPQAAAVRVTAGNLPLDQQAYCSYLKDFQRSLGSTFHDEAFVSLLCNALQTHILTPLRGNWELVEVVVKWLELNLRYLPLGEHLLESFCRDVSGDTVFSRTQMAHHKLVLLVELKSEPVREAMRAFLQAAGEANNSTLPEGAHIDQDSRTVVVLSVKNGAGGHTAPHRAMEARLEETGYKVHTIYYDLDLGKDSDPYEAMAVTFPDGTPMTSTLFYTRWRAQKHETKRAKLVNDYLEWMNHHHSGLIKDNAGADVIRQILALKPRLVVTTLAYHWSWQALAYRLAGLKTFLVASDVFVHTRAFEVWCRQRSLPEPLRQVHLGLMTDELDLLRSEGVAHDQFFGKKQRPEDMRWRTPAYQHFELDAQCSVIGAPINPAFEAVTEPAAIAQLRAKWKIPEEAVSVCIFQGKARYDVDIIPALETYRGTTALSRKVILTSFAVRTSLYMNACRLVSLQSSVPILNCGRTLYSSPKDFAELRAISLIDDIKAGGGSTFEGWYLISKGAQTQLLLTPGPKLWWRTVTAGPWKSGEWVYLSRKIRGN